LATLKFIF